MGRPFRISKKEWGLWIFPAALALASLLPDDLFFVFLMLLVSDIAFISLCVGHADWAWYRRLITGLAMTVILMLVGLGKAMREPPPVPVAMFADCRVDSLPIPIPPQSSIHVIAINHKLMTIQNWGISDIPNRTERPEKWPSKEKMDSAISALRSGRADEGPGFLFYRCEFRNHSQANIVNVAVPLTVSFFTRGMNEKRQYTAYLSPMDEGSHFILYIGNDCPVGAAVALPNLVSLQVVGENSRRTVPLNTLHRLPDFMEQLMILPSSPVQWVEEVPCG
jgi:hypothetical protein